LGKHHLIFGGTIRWEKVSDDRLKVILSDKYTTDVTIFLGRKTLREMYRVFEPNQTPAQEAFHH
jgi:hypothetical protein